MENKNYLHSWINTNLCIIKSNRYILLVLCITASLVAQTQSTKPTITSFSPPSGSIGTQIIITGTNFSTMPESNIVFFGATKAVVLTATATTLTVTVPVGATYMPITVLTNGLLAYSSTYFVVTHDISDINSQSFYGTREYSVSGFSQSFSTIADLDEDGKADLIIASGFANKASILRNTSSGVGNLSFVNEMNFSQGAPITVTTGDLDRDGKLDIAIPNSGTTSISIFRNTSTAVGSISFATKVDYSTAVYYTATTTPERVLIGDLNNNGKADIITIDKATGAIIMRNTSPMAGTISYEFRYLDRTQSLRVPRTGNGAETGVIGDLDGDGKLDVVGVDKIGGNISIRTNTTTEVNNITYSSKVHHNTGRLTNSIAIGDLNGDGKLDLVVTNEGSDNISVLRNTSTGIGNDNISFAKTDYSTGNEPKSIAIGDLNGDGLVDLAVVNEIGRIRRVAVIGISIFKNTSTGPDNITFAPKVNFNTIESPSSVSIGDLDGDGEADLVVTYTGAGFISILRNKPSSTLFTAFSFSDGQTGPATIDNTNYTIAIEVAYGTDLTQLAPNFVLSLGAVAKIGAITQERSVTTNNYTNAVVYTIVAADSTTTQDWTVRATTAAANTETDITAFSFPEQVESATINTTNHTVTIQVLYGTNLATTPLVADFTLSTGAISRVGGNRQVSRVTANSFASPVVVTITAQDGMTTQNWRIIVTEVANTQTNIISFSFPGFENRPATINRNNRRINIEVVSTTDINALIATFTLSRGATATVNSNAQESGTTANNFTNQVVYTIRAEDGIITQVWTVEVRKTTTLNTGTNIVTFSLPDQTRDAVIDRTNYTVAIQIVFNSNINALVPSLRFSPGAVARVAGIIQVSGITPNDFTNTVTYAVTAENGTATQDWMVTVTKAPNTETNITTFSLPRETGSAIINTSNHTVDIEVEFGDVSALIPTFTLSTGARATIGDTPQVSGTTANNFRVRRPLVYTITAADGTTTQNWLVTVTIAVNTQTNITAFSLPRQTGRATINVSNHTVALEVRRGTILTALVPTFTLSSGATVRIGSIVQKSGITTNDFNNTHLRPLVYTITAADGMTTQDWTVKATRVFSRGIELFTFFFPGLQNIPTTISGSSTTLVRVTIEVIRSADLTALIATFTTSFGTRVASNGSSSRSMEQISGVTVNNFSAPEVYYTFSSEDTLRPSAATAIVRVRKAMTFSTATNITAFSLPEQVSPATINAGSRTIGIEVRYGTDVATLIPTFTPSPGATATVSSNAQISGTTENDFSSPVLYTITAEDGMTTQDWMASVTTIAASTETDITAFSLPREIGRVTINPDNHTVDLEVEFGDVTALIPTFTLSTGTTATVNSNAQESGTTANDFTNSVIYTITAQDGSTSQEWTVRVTKALNTATDITTFSVMRGQIGTSNINTSNHTVDIEVEYGTNVTAIAPTFELSPGATVVVGGVAQTSTITVNNFTSTVVYTVMAADGITRQAWKVTVTLINTATDIITFSFNEQTGPANIDLSGFSVAIEVEYGTDLTRLVPIFRLSGGATATIGTVPQESGITANNFTSLVVYTITAADNRTTEAWTVRVTVGPINIATDITTFSIPEQTGAATIDNTSHTVDIEVGYGTDVTSLIPTFTLSRRATATIGTIPQRSNITINNFTNTVVYTITAQAGNIQEWMVTVTMSAPNTATDITAFSIPEQTGVATINANDHTVTIEGASGTNVMALVATFTLSSGARATIGSTAQESGTTANDFTNRVVYTITAQDGTTTQNWTVTVIVAPNTEGINITIFSFSEQTRAAIINAISHAITIEVVSGTNVMALVATFTLSSGAIARVGTVMQVSGTTANDFTSSVVYTITAADGMTTQDWTVRVVVASANTARKITAFSFSEQTGPANIDANNRTVTIEVGSGTNVTALVATFTLSTGATARVGTVMQVSGTTANDFTNSVVFTITAVDGMITQDWTVTVSTPPLSLEKFGNVKTYPNPVTDYLNISGINESYSVYLLNMSGKIVYSGANERLLDLSKFNKGIYFLKITVENGDYQIWKIIKK